MGLITLVDWAFQILYWLVIGRCILSFIRHDPYQPFIKIIYDITEPILRPFRRLMPAMGGVDFSPVVALLALMLARSVIIKLLVSIVYL